jgi:hypothetical protein
MLDCRQFTRIFCCFFAKFCLDTCSAWLVKRVSIEQLQERCACIFPLLSYFQIFMSLGTLLPVAFLIGLICFVNDSTPNRVLCTLILLILIIGCVCY